MPYEIEVHASVQASRRSQRAELPQDVLDALHSEAANGKSPDGAGQLNDDEVHLRSFGHRGERGSNDLDPIGIIGPRARQDPGLADAAQEPGPDPPRTFFGAHLRVGNVGKGEKLHRVLLNSI
jgi:hypothetical protein